jgi:hypothetical protein
VEEEERITGKQPKSQEDMATNNLILISGFKQIFKLIIGNANLRTRNNCFQFFTPDSIHLHDIGLAKEI